MADETVPIPVVPAQHAVKYTGLNSADIAALITDFTVTGENATTLTFTSDGQSRSVARDGYIAYTNGIVTDVYNNDDDFQDALTTVSIGDHVHSITLWTGGAKPAPVQE